MRIQQTKLPRQIGFFAVLIVGLVASGLWAEEKRKPADPLDGAPFVTCKGWIIVDGASGESIEGFEADSPRPMASTTKMMTAYLVMSLVENDEKVLDEVVTVSGRAAATIGSTANLEPGDQVTVRELLFGLMLPSGNDASVAFAEHFGNRLAPDGAKAETLEDAYGHFVAAMNAAAKDLGMEQSGFRNPNGLNAEGHHASPRDLALLARTLLSFPLLCEIVNTPFHNGKLNTAEGTAKRIPWKNTNRLLDIEGYDGVKTGTTVQAGACLVSSGRFPEGHFIIVVLGATSGDARYTDTRNLFRYARRQRALTPAAIGD